MFYKHGKEVTILDIRTLHVQPTWPSKWEVKNQHLLSNDFQNTNTSFDSYRFMINICENTPTQIRNLCYEIWNKSSNILLEAFTTQWFVLTPHDMYDNMYNTRWTISVKLIQLTAAVVQICRQTKTSLHTMRQYNSCFLPNLKQMMMYGFHSNSIYD